MVLRALLKAFVLPPMINIVLIIVGLCLWRFRKRLAQSLILFSVLSLWALSTPFVSQRLIATLENNYQPFSKTQIETLEAHHRAVIVVLGGGRYRSAPEYSGADTVSVLSLNRLRYAASLAKQYTLPVLATGGNVYEKFMGSAPTESELMKQVLEKDFGVAVNWIEKQSKTTAENASYSIALLDKERIDNEKISHIILVTHANHMPRAVRSFEQAISASSGNTVTVIPAPMGFYSVDDAPSIWVSLMPRSAALQVSRVALHEWLGQLYYALASN